MENDLVVTNHSVMRFIERMKQHDLSSLKLEYMLEMKLPSMNHIKDTDFMRWISSRLDLTPFREEIADLVSKSITQTQRDIFYKKPDTELWVVFENFRFIIRNQRVVTVVNREHDKHLMK